MQLENDHNRISKVNKSRRTWRTAACRDAPQLSITVTTIYTERFLTVYLPYVDHTGCWRPWCPEMYLDADVLPTTCIHPGTLADDAEQCPSDDGNWPYRPTSGLRCYLCVCRSPDPRSGRNGWRLMNVANLVQPCISSPLITPYTGSWVYVTLDERHKGVGITVQDKHHEELVHSQLHTAEDPDGMTTMPGTVSPPS